MKTLSIIELDQNRLNVSTKTRANIFNWRGQFTPEFVEYILDTFGWSTCTTFDPFCGSGTVLLESARRGLSSTGFEINPAAYAMARFISLSTLSNQERKALCCSLRDRIESLVGAYHDLPLFSSKPTFRESYSNLIQFAADLLSQIESKNEMVLALICLFHAENGQRNDLVPTIHRAFNIVSKKLYDLPQARQPVTADLCDARLAHERLRNSVDLIITSPPYINVFNYHQNYRSIMEVLGFDILKVADSEIGSNRKNRGNRFKTVVQYALDMEEALASFAHCLTGNGLLVLVVGHESRVRGIPFSNSRILIELAQGLLSYEQVTASERVFTNRFGKSIKENILVLRKANHSPVTGNARQVATSHLEKALQISEGDIAEDVRDTLAQMEVILPSPLFSKKGII
jgi:SAM-dependent methyltransferase